MSIIVSIIVPVYNVAPYIQQCLDSTGMLGRNDIEIILVNDGSTDDSGAICKEYCEKWCNVQLIEKQNGGLSDARNVGTEAARGEFIYYLDSDDWLVPGSIDNLYKLAVENGCDIVQGGFYYAYENYLMYDNRWFDANQKPFILSRKDAMRELINNEKIKNFAWGKLYRSSIVKKHRFIIGKYYEDSFWQHLVISECRKYCIVPDPFYYYRQRPDSISGKFGLKMLDLLEGNEIRLIFIQQEFPEFATIMADKLWRNAFVCMRNSNQIEFRNALNRITSLYQPLFSNSLQHSAVFRISKCKSHFIRELFFGVVRVYEHFVNKPLQRISYPESD